jgi:hypothetical protein
MRRSAIFTLAGAALLMIATFSYGFVFMDRATQESAFRLVIGGTVVGGFLGLLVAELTRSSGPRRIPLILLGAVGGLLAGLVYGVVALEEGCQPSSVKAVACWVFVGRLFRYPWMPIALWTVFGGFIGALVGLAAGFGLPRRESAVEASGRR